jgi:hypothetical protein
MPPKLLPKTAQMFGLATVLGTSIASGQDCKPDSITSLADLKQTVHRVTTSHGYSGWDDKAFNRSGDLAAVAIVQTIPQNELTAPGTLQDLLAMLHMAFSCPARCVGDASARQPNLTMLLLEHLHNSTDGLRQVAVDETKTYVLEQTRSAE